MNKPNNVVCTNMFSKEFGDFTFVVITEQVQSICSVSLIKKTTDGEKLLLKTNIMTPNDTKNFLRCLNDSAAMVVDNDDHNCEWSIISSSIRQFSARWCRDDNTEKISVEVLSDKGVLMTEKFTEDEGMALAYTIRSVTSLAVDSFPEDKPEMQSYDEFGYPHIGPAKGEDVLHRLTSRKLTR